MDPIGVWCPGGGLFLPRTNIYACRKGYYLRHSIQNICKREVNYFSLVCKFDKAIKLLNLR
jgi:hypothetical protein